MTWAVGVSSGIVVVFVVTVVVSIVVVMLVVVAVVDGDNESYKVLYVIYTVIKLAII
jgi:hypothetical protein